MPRRNVNFRRLRKSSIGDLRDCISLENRAITAPNFNNVGFTENYTQIIETWAKVETGFENRVFDQVALEPRPSHRFTIRFRDNITTETRIRYKDNLFRIIQIDNPEERDEYLILMARLEGDDQLEANQ